MKNKIEKIKNYLPKIKSHIIAHKIISAVILVVVLFSGYWIYGKITNTTGEIQYITSLAKTGTIVSSITASGQVESSNQIDLKAEVSGLITYVGVKPGDKVTKYKTLFSIDNKDTQKSIRDAELSLESAKIAFEKFKIQNSNENMNADLAKAYTDGFSTVSSVFLDLPSTLSEIDNMLAQNNLSDNAARGSGHIAQDYRNMAQTAYYDSQTAYNKNKNTFSTLDYNSKQEDLDALIVETYNTTKLLANAIKYLNNYVNYLAQDAGQPDDFASYQTSLSTYTNTINGHVSTLSSAETSIKNYKDAFLNGDLDTQSQLLSIKQKENSLQDLKDKLSDYYVRAPFDGTIASVIAKIGDTATGTLASIITNQKIASLSMNEVDVSKIKLGQKATVTFDAIDDLSMTGTVVEIDAVGTVSQGVVSYSVKIGFDTDDTRVKPGMSVSAAIITDSKTDVLMVPASAIKTTGDTKYVLMFSSPLASPAVGSQGTPSKEIPNQTTVETGITDDTNTEIISGLKEGDQVVSRTITSTAKTATQTPSLLGGGTNRNATGSANFGR